MKVLRSEICMHTEGKEPKNLGKEPKNHSCIFDYCRKLVASDIPDTKLQIYNGNFDELSITLTSTHKAATIQVRENAKHGPEFIAYQPYTGPTVGA